MQTTAEVRHVSVSIERPADDVYRFVADIANWSQWAAGLGAPGKKVGDHWTVSGPLGEVQVRLTAPNAFRILDHDVTLASGVTMHNPLRVVPNAKGSEVVFSVFRRPGMSDEDFRVDTGAVEKDLRKLKQLLESR